MDVIRSQILLVDDHPLFRAGLAAVLSAEPDFEVTGQVSSAHDAVASMHATGMLDLAVVDVLMPTNGIAVTSELLAVRHDLKILALSVLDEPTIIASMLKAGASGYAVKTQGPIEVMQAIRAVLAGVRYIPPRVSRTRVTALLSGSADAPLRRLTRREREIFDLLVHGHSNDDVATRLFISRRTVETHRQRIMKKLGTRSLLDMIRVGAREGAL